MYYVTRADGTPVLPGDQVGSSGAVPGTPLRFAEADPTLVYLYPDGGDPANATPLPPAVLGLRILRPDNTEWPFFVPPAPPRRRDGSIDDRYHVDHVGNGRYGVHLEGVQNGSTHNRADAWRMATRHLMAALYREHVTTS